jgi:hypothetical protein
LKGERALDLKISKRKVAFLFVSTLLMTSFVFVQVGVEQPSGWYFKASYEDYAPSGVPDFDQRQDNWNNSAGAWTWCGPLAVANSLWWFDSKFEPNPVPPPTINDGFPLLPLGWTGMWDDHHPDNVQPFVNRLAWFMDTDGQRTGLSHSGTRVRDMEAGIAQYLQDKWPLAPVGLNPLGDANGDGRVDGNDETIVLNAMGSVPGALNWDLAADLNGDNMVDPLDLNIVLLHFGEAWGKFYEKTVKKPSFDYVAEQVEKSEDVILLLGFWQNQSGGWERFGGHFVTVAGVDSSNLTIAFSDPAKDDAELGYPGQVIPPAPHPHRSTPPFPLHNNASYVSHDYYEREPSPSPGGDWGPKDYNRSIGIIENFIGQNFPKEFEQGPYNPSLPVYVEVEYAVIVSPTPDAAITNVTPEKTVIPPSYQMPVNVTVANQGLSTETFNVTAYYHETEGFESGTFAGWDFYYSTNGAQSGTIPAGTWSSSIVSGANALSGTYSARLFADSDASFSPWQVKAAINRTVNRASGSVLRATLKFDDIQGSGGNGHSFFAIQVFNAADTSKWVSYGFSTTGDYGDVPYTVSPGDLVNFQRNIVADYFSKYGESLPDQIMISFLSSADYAEGIPDRRTTDVRIDDICVAGLNTPMESKTVTLTGGNSTVLTFTWNTTGLPEGNYIMSAVAEIVPGEVDTADNAYVDDMVSVEVPQIIPGDVNGDGTVDTSDLIDLNKAYGCMPGDKNWDERCDFNWDDKIDVLDVFILSKNYGKTI